MCVPACSCMCVCVWGGGGGGEQGADVDNKFVEINLRHAFDVGCFCLTMN